MVTTGEAYQKIDMIFCNCIINIHIMTINITVKRRNLDCGGITDGKEKSVS
jgi:hypothetical protein